MPGRADDPYPPPFTEHKDHHPAFSRRLAFRRGFNRGACWSLILAVPLAAMTFVNVFNANSMRFNAETETTMRITLSWFEIALCAVPAIALAGTFVTLPWALVAAIVAVRRRARLDEGNVSN